MAAGGRPTPSHRCPSTRAAAPGWADLPAGHLGARSRLGSGRVSRTHLPHPAGLGSHLPRRGALRAVWDGDGPSPGGGKDPWWAGLRKLSPKNLPAVRLLAKAKEADVVRIVYLFVAGAGIVAVAFPPDLQSGRVTDGVSLLGVFYVFSQSIERLLEPLKAFFRFGEAKKEAEQAGSAAVEEAIGELKKCGAAIEEGKLMEEVVKVGPEILGAIAAGIAEDDDDDDDDEEAAGAGAEDSKQADPGQPAAGGAPITAQAEAPEAAATALQITSRDLPDSGARRHGKRGLRKQKKKEGKENVRKKVVALQEVKEDVGRIQKNTAVIFWGMASAMAMMLSLWSHIGLLHAVGLDPPASLDVIVTGLAVGAGTQPLNKIISVLKK